MAKKKRKRKETDIVTDVIRRKKDIIRRETTVKKRKKRIQKRKENMKDPIFAATNPQTVARKETKNSRHVREQKRRRTVIMRLTSRTFKCPSCKVIKLETKQWIISKDNTRVICRSCFQVHKWTKHVRAEMEVMKLKLYSKIEHRYKLKPLELCRMRENLKLSVEQFAELIGWSPDYQYKLESGKVLTLSAKTMYEIVEAFKRKNKFISMTIWGLPKNIYVIKGALIRETRKAKLLTMSEFALRSGWSISYQHKIETGKIKKVSRETMDIIYKVLTNQC